MVVESVGEIVNFNFFVHSRGWSSQQSTYRFRKNDSIWKFNEIRYGETKNC